MLEHLLKQKEIEQKLCGTGKYTSMRDAQLEEQEKYSSLTKNLNEEEMNYRTYLLNLYALLRSKKLVGEIIGLTSGGVQGRCRRYGINKEMAEEYREALCTSGGILVSTTYENAHQITSKRIYAAWLRPRGRALLVNDAGERIEIYLTGRCPHLGGVGRWTREKLKESTYVNNWRIALNPHD
jgi:hypothetical protein